MHPVFAYIGPGAGFAFFGSFLTLVLSALATTASLLLWPFRMVRMAIRRRRGMRATRVKKLIFLGLDGLGPELTETWMAEGKLPNLARLREQGSYQRLRTTSSRAIARGMVDLRDRSESGEAQHFRFSESRVADVRAGAFLGEGAPRASRVAHRQMGDSAAAVGGDAPKERASSGRFSTCTASRSTILRVR